MTDGDKKKPVVVLQVIGEMELGGAESRIMDITRELDPEKCHYDFLVFNPKVQHYDPELEQLGCRIYRLTPRFRMYNYFAFCRSLKKFFQEHPEIDIVQAHMTSVASIVLPIAKRCGVRCTIAHARSAGVDPGMKGTLTKWLRRKLYRKADVCFACSKEAAISVYGKNNYDRGTIQILPNAIDLSRYLPTAEHTEEGNRIREKYALDGKLVIGHVGRFHYAKNHEFLLEVFRKIRNIRTDAKLLLVGDGSVMKDVRAKAEELGLTEHVIFAGAQADPAPFYQAMDLMVFPSRYEGLPGTVVEAQAACIPVLMSDRVTDAVAVTPLVESCSLEKSAEEWAHRALTHWEKQKAGRTEEDYCEECYRRLCEKGFDVKVQTRMLEDRYGELLQCAE